MESLILDIQKSIIEDFEKVEKILTYRQWCILSSLQSLNLKYSIFYSTQKKTNLKI
jgi:hypothetical protein